ncbi:4a-hydroxytetrahydrobiopterin dehydratase [Nocardioides sp. JQ2195]|uniref:4a-hydroxytetrahydrobiopterin dehydratase n=1 Tax=Nocardioides sp. JQ2195 TaxID=2592334 RepID=UPI00143E1025|nr:4a-hydroxytetrahydrobiopterin dehydratase [Nocardioides sp. JQ2195]QIX26122.1 4a-hydroxytetrahydrobiopterin dehydratase [Nocardioides sp. JQ2195]
MGETLSDQQVHDAGLSGWALRDDALHLHCATGDFATGLALVNEVGAAAEDANHHPDIDLRYGEVTIRLSSHDVGGVSERDVALARRISELAAGAGVKTTAG